MGLPQVLPLQSGSESNGNEGVLHIPQTPTLTIRCRLMPYPGLTSVNFENFECIFLENMYYA